MYTELSHGTALLLSHMVVDGAGHQRALERPYTTMIDTGSTWTIAFVQHGYPRCMPPRAPRSDA